MPKAAVLDQDLLLDRIVKHLSQSGPSKAKDLCTHLQISQSAFSRLVGQATDAVLRVGQGRQTLYACHRVGAWGNPKIPATTIDAKGHLVHVATLHPLAPQGFFLESHTPDFFSRIYKSWPYFLEDLRPAGFLGRLVPKLYPHENFPDDITAWSDDHCLIYLVRHGWNLIGNVMIGERSVEEHHNALIKRMDIIPETDREKRYPQIADLMLSQGIPGSSAAGEQPKFLLTRKIVKFSPPIIDAISRRVADLLICEHIAHATLKAHGKLSLDSCLVRGADRLFLEMDRFDRTVQGGRLGIISLRALDLEFVGHLKTWSDTARSLLEQNKIRQIDYETIVWLEVFGKFIGNSDRHHGNISFFCDGEIIAGIAPTYDMLPMMYAPQQNQLIARIFEPELPKFHEMPVWKKALIAACDFWRQVQGHSEISNEFKQLTINNESKLEKYQFSSR